MNASLTKLNRIQIQTETGAINRHQGVKRRKKTTATTSSMSIADTYSWVKNKNDIKLYSIVNELPTELQIQMFSAFVLKTHGASDVIKLIDPN
ncbi:unnamed protein product [Ambrosiozyma monospora]|uniref:Unnamed protein product n=1 Tax=Ambrosiozyma monospora TaxID=43982 RepID=A0ACB5TZ78_AMBMO|nr:unnamed protein product [Ambrosiozyma monospora]